ERRSVPVGDRAPLGVERLGPDPLLLRLQAVLRGVDALQLHQPSGEEGQDERDHEHAGVDPSHRRTETRQPTTRPATRPGGGTPAAYRAALARGPRPGRLRPTGALRAPRAAAARRPRRRPARRRPAWSRLLPRVALPGQRVVVAAAPGPARRPAVTPPRGAPT